MYGTKDAAQCFDVAGENAMIAMGYDTGNFSVCLYHSSAVDMSVFRHGDDFVVSGPRTQQKEFEEQFVQASHRQASCYTGTMHSSGRRYRGEDTEQDCEIGQTSITDRDVNVLSTKADPGHAELIIHQLGLSCSSRSVHVRVRNSKHGVDLSSVAQQCGSRFVPIGRNEQFPIKRTGALDASTDRESSDT